MIREDRELLAELALLNTDMPSLALRIMEGSATASEQRHYAQRLIAAGERLRQRAATVVATVIEADVVEEQVALTSSAGGKQSVALPSHTVEPDWRHTTHVF